ILLPKFHVAVSGMKACVEQSFPLEFPADYGCSEVAGTTAQVAITVTEVTKAVLPEVNDEFAKTLGQLEGDVEALLKDIRENIEREVAARVLARTKASVMDALLAATQFDVPKALVDNEIQSRIAATREELKSRGLPDADK